MVAWDQIEAGANLTISVAYLGIAVLIIVPIVRLHQVASNKLATATAAIFFSCALGHFTHFLGPITSSDQGMAGGSMSTWWTAAIHASTACIALYYLSLRRYYGRLLNTAPMFDDLEEKKHLSKLEALQDMASARAAAEHERDFAVALMKSITQHSQALIYVKDLDGRFLMVNPAYERTFGMSEAELLGKTFDVVDASVAEFWRAADHKVWQGSRYQEGSIELADGRHYFESNKFPVYDHAGEPYAVCGLSLDVTAQKNAMAELAAARDEAVAATAAKSAFLATMSHEIRTPMNAVIGMTDLLLDTEVDGQQHEFLETVRSSGDALLAVINDILDFSKLESGAIQLASTPFDLRDEVEGCLDLVAAAASAKRLELVSYLDDSCPAFVVGDADRIRQIVINLLSNAVKFTEHGEVLLTATAAPAAGDELELTINVTDTGVGISSSGMSRLFQSFSQVDASATRAHGGTGLGLTISRRLARAMGGDVQVVSTPGDGSTFTATVIVGIADTVSETRPDPAALDLSNLGVLIVDDNATNRRILDLQLSSERMACTTAATPTAALALVSEGLTYDIALVDMNMPEMNGLELAAALRDQPGTADSPIIVLTSMGMRPTDLTGNVATILVKPVKTSRLRSAISAALARRLGPEKHPHQSGADEKTRSLRVLLAEDNLVNQRVAQLMLTKLGHTVDIVSTGRAAVDAVTVVPYDVVLMDVQMPEMDGLEATRRIRAELTAEQQPYIIAMTANAMAEDREACLSVGMQDYLAKPVRADELKKLLVRVARESGAPDPLRS